MENNKAWKFDGMNPSIQELLEHLERHDAFLKTPEGAAWKKIQLATVDYLGLPQQFSETDKSAFEHIRTLFAENPIKRGDLFLTGAVGRPIGRCRSDLTASILREHLLEGKGVFSFNVERPFRDIEKDISLIDPKEVS